MLAAVTITASKCERYHPQHTGGPGVVEQPEQQQPPPPAGPHWPDGHEKGYW